MRRWARHTALAVVITALTCALAPSASAGPSPRATDPWWVRKLDSVIGGRPFSVALGDDRAFWYRHLAAKGRPPASNEKLLLSMALLNRLPVGSTIRTRATATVRLSHGVLQGSLWLVGNGDPETNRAALKRLARRLVDGGLRRITGSVRGGTRPFSRDWDAPGWKDYFPALYIPLPTALTFEGNEDAAGVNITDPELRAAAFFTQRLERLGVKVGGPPRAGKQPDGLRPLAWIDSEPLRQIVRRMCLRSRNFYAEVLGKRLGLLTQGKGSIAAAARQIEAYVASRGLSVTAYDASGLSYDNRAQAQTFVRLLWDADGRAWGTVLRSSLPHAGQGTLKGRLKGIKLHAKTGTLTDASALTGWVWLKREDRWAEFSIMSSGFDDTAAKGVEDTIVRVIAKYAVAPA